MVKAVVGANWGDEGKGKITDTLADSADVVIRFQGGANAGHTIVNQYGKFALHTLPSGAFHQNVMNIIGNGVALNIPILFHEMQSIIEKGVPAPQLMISDRCQIVMPYHILFDQLEEERLAGKSFGSTKSGIAPFYSDKYAKIGFQVNELFQDEAVLAEKIADVCVKKDILLQHLYHKDPIDQKELLATLLTYRDMIAPFVGNVSEYLAKAIKEDKTILLEGQLGTMKDPDHGIYPMVTSSSTLAAYGAIGAGLPPYAIEKIVVVNKAYSSAVGAGEFTSEIFGYLDEIPVCVAYEIDGEQTTEFPVTHLLKKAKPVWKTLPGWKCDIRGIKNYEDLPENCRNYIEFIEAQIGYPITMVSNGPGRTDIIYRESKLA